MFSRGPRSVADGVAEHRLSQLLFGGVRPGCSYRDPGVLPRVPRVARLRALFLDSRRESWMEVRLQIVMHMLLNAVKRFA